MVYFKITDGEVTRKFKVTPDEITFDQLKERIRALFPKALDNTENLLLQYRDVDNDVITISSNEEFQDVLSEFPKAKSGSFKDQSKTTLQVDLQRQTAQRKEPVFSAHGFLFPPLSQAAQRTALRPVAGTGEWTVQYPEPTRSVFPMGQSTLVSNHHGV